MGDSVDTVVDSHAADRAAFLAGDGDAGEEALDTAKSKPSPKAAPVEDDDDAPDADDTDKLEAAADDDDDLDEDTDDEPDDEDSLDDDDDEDEAGDPQLKKRLAQVRRFEQRTRERLTAERAELQREIDHWKPRVEKFEALAKRVKYETAAVLRELGLSEEDFEDAARELYASSTKGSADPKNREAVARSKRERELADEVKAVKAKLAEREEQERQSQLQREANEQAEKYVRSVTKKIDPEQHPLAAKQRAKNPAKLQERLSQVAYELAQKIGTVPKPERVLARYEKIRRAELEELGIDLPALKKTTTKTGEKTTAKGAKPDPKAEGDTRDDIVRDLMAGDYD